MIPHNRPLITEPDREAVDAVLRSSWIAGGEQVSGLEADFGVMFGGGGGCATSSGTAALYLALKTIGIGNGERVAVPTYSCSALLDAVFAAGGRPLVVDVSDHDLTIDPDSLERERERAGGRVAATIAVHTHGARAPLEQLVAAGGGTLIQDCCHSLGGRVDGLPIGHDGPLAVFSFFATKIITCGQGGLMLALDEELARAARDFRDTETRPDYRPRFNIALTDFQAAMARSQLQRLEAIASRRREISRRYLGALRTELVALPSHVDDERMVHRFVLRGRDRAQRDRLADHFRRRGVTATAPVQHDDLLHNYMGLDPARFPVAEALASVTLSLPVFPGLRAEEVDVVVDAVASLPA